MRSTLGKPWLIFILVAFSGPEAYCQEKEELLPPPRAETPLVMPVPNWLAPPPPPLGPRDIWQYYGVDQSGKFRPRVIYSPMGAYYLHNRQPFPWTTTRPSLYMRFIVN